MRRTNGEKKNETEKNEFIVASSNNKLFCLNQKGGEQFVVFRLRLTYYIIVVVVVFFFVCVFFFRERKIYTYAKWKQNERRKTFNLSGGIGGSITYPIYSGRIIFFFYVFLFLFLKWRCKDANSPIIWCVFMSVRLCVCLYATYICIALP